MTERSPVVTIETPCVKTCTIDPGTRLCIGCLRSLDEIASWSRMTPEERRAIMNALPSRAASVEARSEAPRPASPEDGPVPPFLSGA